MICFSRVTLKLGRWPRKTIGHLFYATSSFAHHFLAIGEFKQELYLNCTFWYGRQHIIAREDFSDCIPSGHRQRVHWTKNFLIWGPAHMVEGDHLLRKRPMTWHLSVKNYNNYSPQHLILIVVGTPSSSDSSPSPFTAEAAPTEITNRPLTT